MWFLMWCWYDIDVFVSTAVASTILASGLRCPVALRRLWGRCPHGGRWTAKKVVQTKCRENIWKHMKTYLKTYVKTYENIWKHMKTYETIDMLKFFQSCINQEVLTKSIRVYLNVCTRNVTRIFFGRPSGWELAGNSAHADGTAADRLCWLLRSTESDCVPLHSAGCSAGCSADSGGIGGPNHQTQPSIDLERSPLRWFIKVVPFRKHSEAALPGIRNNSAEREIPCWC